MIATVILGFAAAGLVVPFTSGAAARAYGDRQTLAAAVATDLLEQIIATPYDQVVAVWNGYSEPRGQMVMDFDTGRRYSDPAYAPFSRAAAAVYVYVAQQDAVAVPNFIAVTVTVSCNGREVASITRLISK